MANFDVLMVSDLRWRGGSVALLADEIRAQATAGYRTALLHVDAASTPEPAGISRPLRTVIYEGGAELMLPEDQIHARHAIVWGAHAAQALTGPYRDITAQGVSLIANRTPGDAAAPYAPDRADEAIWRSFGHRPTWRPTDPVVRHSLSHLDIDLAAEDWLRIVDAGTRPPDRAGALSIRPVIGVAGPVRAWLLAKLLGVRGPGNRTDTDFVVAYESHDRDDDVRTILRALAAGAVVVGPESLRELFGDAVVYASRPRTRRVIAELAADGDACLQQSRRGHEMVVNRHSYAAHQRRVAQIVGPPAGRESDSRTARVSQRDTPARVLFVTTNGTGMGHLTRLLAMATRASEAIEPLFLSMSSAVPVVARYGYGWEYCPSRDDLDVSARAWNPIFTDRLHEIVRRFEPAALVFDGVVPYDGLGQARQEFPDLRFVWSRRPMWRSGVGVDYLERSSWFDLVIEPGELAAAADRGPTVGRGDAVRVRPITLLDPDDLLDRDQARAELGIDPDAKAVLVTLGAGNYNDLTSDLDVVADAFKRRDGWRVYGTQAAIARQGIARRDITTLSVYPLARYLAAFDMAVVAAGYNSYHETIMAGLPTIFVPKAKGVDDQHARAHFAAEAGVGLAVDVVERDQLEDAIGSLLDPRHAVRIREQCAARYPGNGADEAVKLIEDVVSSRGGRRGR